MAKQYEDERGISLATFLVGAGVGALLGAAVALLMAPQSGHESREDVKEALSRLGSRTGEIAGQVKERAAGYVQQKREEAVGAVRAFRKGAGEIEEKLEAGSDDQA